MRKLFAVLLLFVSLGVAAAQGPAFPYSVTLSWTPSVTTGVTGQNVYRAPYASSACGTYVLLTTTQLGPTITSFTDSSVVPAAQYCYEITALVGTAESGPDVLASNPVSLPPAPPTGLSDQVK
jgi:hypothetical protein